MNEGIAVYRALSVEQREERLLRSGVEAALSIRIKRKLLGVPAGNEWLGADRDRSRIGQERLLDTYSSGISQGKHRQRYKISIYNLAVLKITPLGAGPGMKAASLSTKEPQDSDLTADSEILDRESPERGGGDANTRDDRGAGGDGNSRDDRRAEREPNSRDSRRAGGEANSRDDSRAERDTNSRDDGRAGGGTNSWDDRGAGGDVNSRDDSRAERDVNSMDDSRAERDVNSIDDGRAGGGTNSWDDRGAGGDATSRDDRGGEGGTASWVIPEGRRGFRRLVNGLAVRALYSLGLDSGEVLLAAMGDRRYVVEKVTPLTEASGVPLPEPYTSAALALKRRLALERPGRPGLLMGMDPEFLLLRESTGRVVPASRYLPTDGVAGCDEGPPGTRGAFPVAELRPQPRGEPRALLAQLMSAAATADRLIADRSLRWRAGGMPLTGWALGGHLHFSGVTLTAPLLRALDNYLALPIMLLEDARAGARRPRYGVLGDFRYQPHGGFEYRTLPSFLVSPVIAKGAVHLAHLIVSHYEDLRLRPLDREDLHAAYYSGDRTQLRAAFSPLAAQLRSLGGYEKAARYIEPLFHYIAAGRTWDESRDIRGLWRSREAP